MEAGDGPAVVLVHGFPEFWFSWRHQLPFLESKGFRAIAIDLPGYNDSWKPRDVASYSMSDVAAEIAGFIRQTVPGGKCALIGHDWGAFASWFVGMLHPDVVERLVILNAPHPAPFRRELKRSIEQKLRLTYQLFFQPPVVPEAMMRAFGFLMLRQLLLRSGRFKRDEVQQYVEAWRKPGALTGMANYYRAVRKSRARLEMRPIEVPALLIWGERDPVFMRATTENFSEWVPNLRVERIHSAGHFVQTDAPDRVNELLAGFLR